MDPALLLLWRLRLRAFFRRWGKNLRKPKGILLTLVGLLVFVPWMLSLAYTPREAMPFDPERVRRFGPLALLAYAALTLALSTGERALFFTPAEIDFLFPGPFTRRGLLAYKVVGIVFGVLFSSLFIGIAFLRSSRNFGAGYVAIVLAMLFFQLLGMAVSLASNTVAAFATSVRRKVVVAALIGLSVATVWSTGSEVLALPPLEAIGRVEASPAIRAATWPFRPFVMAYTAGRLWPEMIGWTAACLGMVAAMLAVVFAIDAQYLETAAASSARMYEKIQKMRQGGLMPGRTGSVKKARFRVAMLPWWGGVGPVLWRQLSTAIREPGRLLLLAAILVGPGLAPLFGRLDASTPAHLSSYVFAGMALYLSGLFSAMVAFDFRGDVDRMEVLKALPIAPPAIVIGQLLTPVLVFSLPSWVAFGLASPWIAGAGLEDLLILGFIPAVGGLMIGIDNLLFLVFPSRSVVATAADFASMGRQVLLVLAKLLGGGLTIGAASLVGLGCYYLLGGNRLVAYAAALAVATAAALAIIPFLVLAFVRYDVASDSPA